MVRLDTEWCADRKSYRDPDQNLTIAEATQDAEGVKVRFYDDHYEKALLRFSSQTFPNWDSADYAVLLIAQETTK